MPVSGVSGSKTTYKASSHPLVRYGSHGSAVKELQQALNKHGYKLSTDGDFGPKTLAAVKSYQSKHGLAADGVVGPKTWASLHGQKVGGSSSSSGTSGSSSTGPTKTVTGYQNGHKTTIKVAYVGNGEWMNAKCAASYKNMLAAAKKAGVYLGTTDGYRTYAEQAYLYKKYGSPRAAHPGYSNHQMGWSADIAGVGGYNTRAYRWLKNNASRFGFRNDVGGEYWHWTYHH